jgi:hypothetical protein
MFVFDLPYHVHDFDSRDCFLGRFERLESQHRFYDFLYVSMILFNILLRYFCCRSNVSCFRQHDINRIAA